MRYNKIFAGPATENLPQVVEAQASTALLPGQIATFSAGKLAAAAANTTSQILVVQDNYLAMLGPEEAYQVDETCMGLVPLDDQLYNCRFAASTAVTKGQAIALAASGILRPLPGTAGTYIVVGYADETVTLAAGGQDLIRVRFTQPRQVTI